MIGKTQQILLTLITLSVMTSCKTSGWRADISQPDFILGPNDIRVVADIDPDSLPIAREIFDKASVSSPMIMVKLKKGWKRGARFCSGILLAGTDGLPRVLTNQHCFREKAAEDTPNIKPDACASTVVYFDKIAVPHKRNGIVPKLVRKCKRGSLRTSFEGDMAIFTLAEALPSDYTFTDIWQDDEIPDGRQAFAIHYPSAKEAGVGMVSIDGGINGKAPPKSITADSCLVRMRFPSERADKPDLKNVAYKLRYSVIHNCDLAGGSSGAGLLDAETGKLLAVHLGGVGLTTINLNTATHALHLRQFLAGEKLTLP